MRRALVVAAGAAVLLAAVFLWLLATRTPPPPIPAGPEHRGAAREHDCLTCHAADGPAPKGRNHPLSQRCFQCHVRG